VLNGKLSAFAAAFNIGYVKKYPRHYVKKLRQPKPPPPEKVRRPCITCFQDITGRGLRYCSDMCIQQKKSSNRERRGHDTKEMKAKRSAKIEAEVRAALDMIKELKDDRSAISQFIKAVGFDPGSSGETSGSVDPN